MERPRKHIPNPLFEQWIQEWYEKAKAEKNSIQHYFYKALQSLKKCPLTFESGTECIIMEHFGKKICDMLDKRLRLHRQLEQQNTRQESISMNYEQNATSSSSSTVTTTSKKRLHKQSNEDVGKSQVETSEKNKSKRKKESIKKDINITEILEILSEAKSTDSSDSTFFTMKYIKSKIDEQTGSESTIRKFQMVMNSLVESNYVLRLLNPVRYAITQKGLAFLSQPSNDDFQPGSSNSNKISSSISTGTSDDSSERRILDAFFEQCTDLYPQATSSNKSSEIHSTDTLANPDKILTNTNQNRQHEKDPEPVLESLNHQTTSSLKSTEANGKPKKRARQNQGQKSKSKYQNGDIIDIVDEEKDDSNEARVVLEAGTFDIVLLVDVHEINSKSKPNDTTSELYSTNTNFAIRHLNVGDFTWVARCRSTENELVLPYVVERKEVDDLSSSIKDGRFHEQKFRLKRSGIKNKIYLVEGLSGSTSTSIPVKSLFQACINSLVQDGFSLKYTKNHTYSIIYLSLLTKMLTNKYKNKRLISCKKSELPTTNDTKDVKYLMNFTEFNQSSVKNKALKVKEMLIRQLAQMKGLSIDKAMAIVELYPTSELLRQEFIRSGENLLTDIRNNSGKQLIGSVISQKLHKFYTSEQLN